MNAETRCAKAIADGKYRTKAEWCRALLKSTDSRIPTEWRFWALSQISVREGETDPRGWSKRLKAREEAGEKLLACQSRAWRAAEQTSTRIQASRPTPREDEQALAFATLES